MAAMEVIRRLSGWGGSGSGRKPRLSLGLRIGRWLKAQFGNGRVLALALLIGLCVVRLYDPFVIDAVRVRIFDLYMNIHPREVTDERRMVTIVDLDDRSLQEVGQWPWPRTTVAEMVERIMAMGAVVVGFDIIFAEADRLSPTTVAPALPGLDEETRNKLLALPSNDSVLAAAVERGRVVLGQSVSQTGNVGGEYGDPRTAVSSAGCDPTPYLRQYGYLLRNLPILDRVAAGRGMFNVTEEPDGVIRRVPLVVNVENSLQPALSLDMLRLASGNNTIFMRCRDGVGIELLALAGSRNPVTVRVDRNAQVWVNFSRYDTKKYVPAVDVLRGTADPAMFQGKLVLIGTSAVGLLDIKRSPVDFFLPGVEVHANIIENIIDGTQLVRPADSTDMEVMAMLAGGLLIIVLVPLAGALYSVLALWGSWAAFIGGSWWYFRTDLVLYDPFMPALTAVMLYMLLTYTNYSREEAQRRQVRDAFSRYMSPALVEQLAAEPDKLRLGGEMKDMTILFCDVRGFTTISEKFRDNPEGLTKLINRFLTPMTNVILERQGTIDKYMGDCIMAFWNAPLDDEKHAFNACRSALAMMECMKEVNVALKAEAEATGEPHFPLAVGIGLNSGQACVGNMGSDQRFDYSVLGDTVNLASRLEGQSKTYGVDIVIGDQTHIRAPEYATLELDLIKVKGKKEPVRIFTLLGGAEVAADPAFQALAAAHAAMLAAYRAQDWTAAATHLSEARGLAAPWHLAGLYELYEERITAYAAEPPGADWDGVFTALTK